MTDTPNAPFLNRPYAPWSAPPRAAAARLARALESRIITGELVLRRPDGAEHVLRGARPGPTARVELRRWRALARTALGGAGGLARAYMAGEWDSPDPAAVIEFAARNMDADARPLSLSRLGALLRRARHLLRINTRAGSRRNIAFHYDLGNAFYRCWLDAGMTYSAAWFAEADVTLEAAQAAKYRRIIESLGARAGEHVLEIGCGWGGFAVIAARDYGLRVTGITLSREQYTYAVRRAAEAGLADRVRFELCDYREVTGTYDHVVSIEMIEAVGERYWPVFFRTLADRLAPGGRAALQTITIDDRLFEHYRRRADFIQDRIFPGGMLPSPSALEGERRRVGLGRVGEAAFGRDYARTLAAWRQRFGDAWPAIEKLGFDDAFRRLWTFYLAYCEGGFRAGRIDVRQIVLRKPAAGGTNRGDAA